MSTARASAWAIRSAPPAGGSWPICCASLSVATASMGWRPCASAAARASPRSSSGPDPVALDLETREQLIDTVRRFVAERLRPLEAKVAEDDAMPGELVEEMKGLGLFGLSIPEAYGGLDLSMEDECLVAVELGRTSPAFR